MKILFGLSSPEYLRYYDTTIRALADRGHEVTVAVHTVRRGKPVPLAPIDHPRVTVTGMVPPRADRWEHLAQAVRGTMDFVRYFHPRLAAAAALRTRMKRQALPWVLQWLDRISSLPPAYVARMMRLLTTLERAIPPGRPLLEYLDEHAPDVVLVSPLVEAASAQVDLVRAAQARGIRVGALVASWDNLTNKGDLRVPTDFVVVWNEAQQREAVELHRVAADRVVITGSQVFDRWFDRRPSCGREAFCRTVGLPAGKPFVLYTGSSIFVSRAHVEVPFVRRWVAALRESGDPALRDLAVLVRPHPYNGAAWPDVDFHGLGDVAIWPRGGYNPVDDANRDGFFDSLYYSEAVVGINTSAMIEAAVVGRPVLSILAPDFAESQEGTLHFRHLLPANGGFLRVAASLEEHARQLAEVLRDPSSVRAEIGRFVASFVRPHGVDAPCLPIVVDAIERRGRAPAPALAAASWTVHVLRAILFPVAPLAALSPPEALRTHALARRTREVWLQVQRSSRRTMKRAVVDSVRRVRRTTMAGARAGRRLLAAIVRVAVRRPVRYAIRATRLARYHVGTMARRLRDAE